MASRLGPSAGQLLALHFAFFFFEALLFLRETALSRFLDSAPGATSRGVPDHRVHSRVSNHSLGQFATNTIPVKCFIRKIFAPLGHQRICSGWLVRLHGRLILIQLQHTRAIYLPSHLSLSLFVPWLFLNCCPGETTHALCGEIHKF